MIVVSDTSPIINLAVIGQLRLIPLLFERIVIPPAIYHEVVVQGAGLPGSEEIKNADWVVVRACSDLQLLDLIIAEKDIHIGEAEAICLAVELKADAILLDEAVGRNLARTHHLSFIGILGILLKAKEKGFILEVKPLLLRLQSEAGFYIHKSLIHSVLTLAGE